MRFIISSILLLTPCWRYYLFYGISSAKYPSEVPRVRMETPSVPVSLSSHCLLTIVFTNELDREKKRQRLTLC